MAPPIIGSFPGVLVTRLPEDRPLVGGRSACDGVGTRSGHSTSSRSRVDWRCAAVAAIAARGHLGFAIFALLRFLYRRLRGREELGLGDGK